MSHVWSCLVTALLLTTAVQAQRGDIVVATSGTITVPVGARLCADRIFANNPGHGSLIIGDVSCLCPGMVITPVELLTFSAALVGDCVHLRWTTLSEQDIAGYEVQRSFDAALWENRGFVPAEGGLFISRDYEFRDEVRLPPLTAVLHYRLAMHALDGSIEYSPVVALQRPGQPGSVLLQAPHPNPACTAVTLEYRLPQAATVDIRIHSIIGEEMLVVKRAEVSEAGEYAMTLGIGALPTGSYVVDLVANGVHHSRMLAVRR